MKHTKTLLTAAALAPALWAFATPADRVAFHPESGTHLTKTFTEVTEMTMESMTVSMNGEEMDMGMLGDPQMSLTNTTTRVVTDKYESLADGRPAKLRRTYDTLGNENSMSMEMAVVEPQDIDVQGSSELEGLTVVFTWSEDAGEFVAAFAEEGDGDVDLLEGLTEDMDMRALLPKGEVSPEDTWEIDLDALIPILAPGGDLKIVPDDLEAQMGGMMGPSPGHDMSQILGDLEGTATGEYAGTREVDGVKVGVIKFNFDVSSAKDMTDSIAEMMDKMELPNEEVEISIESMDIEFEFEGEGVLYWNLAAGHMHSFEISGDSFMTMDMAMAMSIPGMGEMEQEMSMEFSGTTTLSGSVRGE